MKKQTYLQPLIEQTEVQVEQGIANSTTILLDAYNQIMDMEEGDAWGVYSE